MIRAWLVFALAVLAMKAQAHHAPNSFVRLDFRAHEVRAQLMVPVSELTFAMHATPTQQALPAYLLKHVGAVTPQGAAWTVTVTAVRPTTYLDQPYLVASVVLAPPAEASVRDFTFTTDAVTHEVRNHVVVIVAERDYADAALGDAPKILGALQYPGRELAIRLSPAAPR
ncbi:MAG: hypothetical protein ABI821_01465 [Pseudomonadota bacterium]